MTKYIVRIWSKGQALYLCANSATNTDFSNSYSAGVTTYATQKEAEKDIQRLQSNGIKGFNKETEILKVIA